MKKEKILSGLLLTTLILAQAAPVLARTQEIVQEQVQSEQIKLFPESESDAAGQEKPSSSETENPELAKLPDAEESSEIPTDTEGISEDVEAPQNSEKNPETDKIAETVSPVEEIPRAVISISSPEELAKIGKETAYPLDGDYELLSSLSLSGYWDSIGTNSSNELFRGSFNGNGFTISGLNVEAGSDNDEGLFGALNGAKIYDLNISGSVTGVGDEYGLLAGRSIGSSITNVHVSGTVEGRGLIDNSERDPFSADLSEEIGGLIGFSRNTSVTNSSADVAISATGRFLGGLIGHNEEQADAAGTATIINATSSGTVTGLTRIGETGGGEPASTSGSFRVGGLIGFNHRADITAGSSSATVVNSGFATGGLIGESISASDANRQGIVNSHATGNVSGVGRGITAQGLSLDSERVGGLIGQNGSVSSMDFVAGNNGSNVRGSSATGDVFAEGQHAGGLIGFNAGAGRVVENSWTKDQSIQDKEDAGGLIGSNRFTTIRNNESSSSVSVRGKYVGGLIGRSSGALIENNEATGSATGKHYVGGLVGEVMIYEGIRSEITGNRSSSQVTAENSDDLNSYSGGLLGRSSDATIVANHAIGDVSGTNQVGGLIGQAGSESHISENYATGNILANDEVGGLIGRLQNATLNRSYAKGNIAGNEKVGGLIGNSFANATPNIITNVYAIGDVTAYADYAGGLIGDFAGYVAASGYDDDKGSSLRNAYASGNVRGANNVGALIGGLADEVGRASYTVANVVAIGDVTGVSEVGGVLGNVAGMDAVSEAYRWDYMKVNGEVLSRQVNNTSEKDGGLVSARELRMENSYANLNWAMGTDWKWSINSANPQQIESQVQHWPVLGFGPEEDTFPHYSITGTARETKMYDGEEVVRDTQSLFTPEYAQGDEFDYTLNGKVLNLENNLVLPDDVAFHEIRAHSKLTPLQTSTGNLQNSGNFPGQQMAQADYEITPRPLLYTGEVWLERQYDGESEMHLQNAQLTSEDWTALVFDQEAVARAEMQMPGVIAGDEVLVSANEDFKNLLSGNHSLDGTSPTPNAGEGVLLHDLTQEQMAKLFGLAGEDAHNYSLRSLENVNTRITDQKLTNIPDKGSAQASLPETGDTTMFLLTALGFSSMIAALVFWLKRRNL